MVDVEDEDVVEEEEDEVGAEVQDNKTIGGKRVRAVADNAVRHSSHRKGESR